MLVATRLAAGFRDEVIISPDPRICMQRGSQCSAHIVFSQDVCNLQSDLFLSLGQKMKLRAFDGRIVFCVVPRFAPNSYAKTHGEIRWQDGQD